jgi:preprotein translocase subunit SecE
MKRFGIHRIQKFLKEGVREMKLVNWPNKHDIKEGTTVVVVMSAIVGIFLSLVDVIFNKIVSFVF